MQEWMNIIVTLLAFAAPWWRLTARTAVKSDIEELGSDMDDADEDLREIIDKLDERMEIGFNRHEARLDAGLAHLDTRISANSLANQADILEVIHKLDGVADDFRAEIGERVPRRTDNTGGRIEAGFSAHTTNEERDGSPNGSTALRQSINSNLAG